MRVISGMFKTFLISLILLLLLLNSNSYQSVLARVHFSTPPLTGGAYKPANWPIRIPWIQTTEVTISQGYGGSMPLSSEPDGWNEHTFHLKLDNQSKANDYYALDFAVGNDLQGKPNSVVAIASGQVVFADWATGGWAAYGRIVYVDHNNGYYSLYAHLSSFSVSEGQMIFQGQELGKVGGSGNKIDNYYGQHLHLSIYQNSHFTIGTGSGKERTASGPWGGKAVVPEPLIGEEVYEGFGLQWNNHNAWFGPLQSHDLPNDTNPGSPGGSWGLYSIANGSTVRVNQPVQFTVESLPSDIKEVRFTAGYWDWSIMDDQTDSAVWRILARCWPNKDQQECKWTNNNTALSYNWVPHGDNFQSNAQWLPQGSDLIRRAFNDNEANKQVCISFDVFDKSGNPTYSPGGTQCTPIGGSPPQSEFLYLPLVIQGASKEGLFSSAIVIEPLSSRNQNLVDEDNSARTIYIAPSNIPTPTPPPSLPADAWYVNYYNDLNLGGGSCNPSTLTLFDNPPQRTFVFKDWGDDAPYSGCNKEFSARIWRRFHLEAGRYNFYLFADDKAKLEVLHAPGGNLIVDQWNATQHIESRTLPAGDYEIVIHYQDSGGAARVHAWWDGPGFPAPPRENRDLNQWHASFWPNTEWFWDAFLFYNDGNPLPLNKQWQGDGPGYGLQTDNFSSKYERIYPFSCGDYRFILNADDYAEIDVWDLESNTLVHHLVTSQANKEVQSSTPVHLLEKKYEVKVKHKEYDGGAQLYVNWVLETPCPTSTPQPTPTWTPTNTPQPTLTWTPTNTPTPTDTPTPTPTPTTNGCLAPDAPGQRSPVGVTVIDNTPTLRWEYIADYAAYQVQIFRNGQLLIDVVAYDVFYTVPAPLADGVYTWQIRSVDVSGGCNEPGDWSTEQSFSIDALTNVVDVVVNGTVAYVAAGSDGLQVIDVSDPGAPFVLGSRATEYATSSIFAIGTMIYLTDNSEYVYLINAEDPTEPELLSIYSQTTDPEDIYVVNDTAYIVSNEGDFDVVDVSNPRNPLFLSQVPDSPQVMEAVFVSGNVAYVDDEDSCSPTTPERCGLRLVDVTDRQRPFTLSYYSTPGSVRGIFVAGGITYLADGEAGIQLVNVINPSNPVFLGRYQNLTYANDLFVVGNRVYVAAGETDGVVVIDVAAPSSPRRITAYDTPGSASHVFVTNNTAYVADGPAGLFIQTNIGQK